MKEKCLKLLSLAQNWKGNNTNVHNTLKKEEKTSDSNAKCEKLLLQAKLQTIML